MTKIYLAYGQLSPARAADFNTASSPPALPISYFYLPGLFKVARRVNFTTWCLDSGAFSAYNSRKPIRHADYLSFIVNELPRSPIGPPEMIFGLDVIGNWRASVKNYEEAWARGVQVVPTWHHGEPCDLLRGLAKDYPKIAVGGMARGSPKAKKALVERCFHVAWPCLIHGFGVTADEVLDQGPLDTVDSTTWCNPYRYGYYPQTGGSSSQMRVKNAVATARPEIEFYLRRERELRGRWGRILAPLRRKYRDVLKPTPYQAVPADV